MAKETYKFVVSITMDKPLWKSQVRKMLYARLHDTQLGRWFGASPGKWYSAEKITIKHIKDEA